MLDIFRDTVNANSTIDFEEKSSQLIQIMEVKFPTFMKLRTTSLLMDEMKATIMFKGTEYIVSKHLLQAYIPDCQSKTKDQIEDILLLETEAMVSGPFIIRLVSKLLQT